MRTTDPTKWHKHPVLPDVLMRTVTPRDLENEERAAAQAERDAAEKVNRRWLKPIPHLDWPAIERLVRRTAASAGLGGVICDVIEQRDGIIQGKSGKRYAARQLALYVEYEVEGGGNDISDSISIIIYRDPVRPRKLRACYGILEMKEFT